jgi:hypothetical protein
MMGTLIGALVAFVILKFAYSLIFEQDKFDKDGNYRK